ncbi:LOW QUALITY PROTEIN: hypothetical protein PanWU01x14_092800 [Parasponia andersonii]|uniref:Uncharacterized protein n=1 Tax=Parasponia andersonii TaxID=3476 RepID=A0A2P5D6N1_PARAD|nr:LOW QUALITY PROTEIN: hypothetical protein PanWU01x14_092800 [Parasponia andersonii]
MVHNATRFNCWTIYISPSTLNNSLTRSLARPGLALSPLFNPTGKPRRFPTLHPPPQPSASDPNHSLRHPNLSLGPNLSFVPQFVENFALFRSLYLSRSLSLSLSLSLRRHFFLPPIQTLKLLRSESVEKDQLRASMDASQRRSLSQLLELE